MQQKRTTFDWLLESVSLAAPFAIAALIATYWNDLPQRVPVHFGVFGHPDGWGPKGALLFVPSVAMGFWAVVTVVSRNQLSINLPVDIDMEAPEVKALILRLLLALKTVLGLIFLYMTWTSERAALGRSEGLGSLFLPVCLVVTTIPIVWVLLKLRRYRM